jgi:dihydrofolate reductase
VTKLRVNAFTVSLDGFAAGPNQDANNPLGVNGMELHKWVFDTRTFSEVHGGTNGSTGINDDFAARAMDNLGAWILGRNMFGPVRGAWPDESWKGWWGDNPPYHTQVFVLTHHPRKSFDMEGGTTFHFVTGGMHEALTRAREAAKGKDVRVGGGVAAIHQYLHAGLVDEMHIAIAPVLLGRGENFYAGIDLRELGYECSEFVPTTDATHVVFTKRK